MDVIFEIERVLKPRLTSCALMLAVLTLSCTFLVAVCSSLMGFLKIYFNYVLILLPHDGQWTETSVDVVVKNFLTPVKFLIESRSIYQQKLLSMRFQCMSILNQSNVTNRRSHTAILLLIAVLFSIGIKFSGPSNSQSDQIFNQICTVYGIQVFNTANDVSKDLNGSDESVSERPCDYCFSQVSQLSHPGDLKYGSVTPLRSDLRLVREKGESLAFLLSHPDHAPPHFS
jgi:hypothetical protein